VSLLTSTATTIIRDHLSGKPRKSGNVREFDSCQGNVRELTKNQGSDRKNIVAV